MNQIRQTDQIKRIKQTKQTEQIKQIKQTTKTSQKTQKKQTAQTAHTAKAGQKNKRQAAERVNTRELALEALLAIARQEAYSHVVISNMLDKYNYLEAQEKAFIKRLTEGTLERQIQLDYCIDQFSSLPVRKMKPLIRELLRMSAYQLLFMDAIPDRAVCNEAVKLAQQHSFHALKGFVNGVLRNISRNKEQIRYPDPQKDRLGSLSVRYSMPQWLIEKWDAEQGREQTEQILQGLLQEKPVSVRLKSGMTEPERCALRAQLEKRGIRITESALLPYAWQLEGAEGLKSIPAFQKGELTVQDVSSMLAVCAAGIKEGDFVIDTCAAPGGKMLFAAELAGKSGRVLARDVSEKKLLLMEENKRRLQADNVTLEQHDARICDKELCGRADVVLADVPCSGLGVIGKKRDIKYRVIKEGIAGLPELQKEILTAVQSYVKEGGVLLYSTCTISRAENEEIAAWFTENFPFQAESLCGFLPDRLLQKAPAVSGAENVARTKAAETIEKGYYQFLPGIDGTDGFFIARFRRLREDK